MAVPGTPGAVESEESVETSAVKETTGIDSNRQVPVVVVVAVTVAVAASSSSVSTVGDNANERLRLLLLLTVKKFRQLRTVENLDIKLVVGATDEKA